MKRFIHGDQVSEDAWGKHHSIGSQYRLCFLGRRRTFFFQLLDSPDDRYTVLLHLQVRVADGLFWSEYDSFISPRDPGFEDPGAVDPLVALLPEKKRTWTPKDRTIARAVELTPEGDGFCIESRRGRDAAPNIGFIVEPRFTFFGPLLERPELLGRAIKVNRSGEGKYRRFTFEDAGPSIPIDLDGPDIEALIAHLADQDRLQKTIKRLPENWNLI